MSQKIDSGKDQFHHETKQELETQHLFFSTSLLKLFSLHVTSFGIYPIYWFYKNWKIQQNVSKDKINPLARTFLLIFYIHNLFRRIQKVSEEKSLSEKFNANLNAGVLVLLFIAERVVDRMSRHSEEMDIYSYVGILIPFLTVLPIYKAQMSINKINNDDFGKSNSAFSVYNIIFLVVGVLLWIGVIFASLEPPVASM